MFVGLAGVGLVGWFDACGVCCISDFLGFPVWCVGWYNIVYYGLRV